MGNRIAITTPEYVKLEFETAGLGSRTLSLLIDWMILGVVQFILIFFGILFFAASGHSGESLLDLGHDRSFSVSSFHPLVLLCSYRIFYEWTNNRETGSGSPCGDGSRNGPGVLAIFLRNLLRVVDGLPFFYLAGGISVFFNRREKRLGDLAAGTMVVQKEKREVPHVHPLFSHREPILTSSELSGILERKWELLGRFLTRREEMFPAARQELAQRLARSLLPLEKVSGGQEEFYLEAAYFQLRNRQRVGESGFLER